MKLSRHLYLVAAGASTAIAATTQDKGKRIIDHAPFADHLTAALYPATGENECTSALGVSMALSLIYPSAIRDSEVQMRTVLGFPNRSQSTLVWDDTTTGLLNRYQGRCYQLNNYAGTCDHQEPTLEIANGVFVDNNVTLNATYQKVVGDLVQQLDFSSPESGSLVNEWVNESSNGLIETIVDEGALEPWIILAINSLYLKASWTEQFNEAHTNQDSFYNSKGRTSSTLAHFMHKVDHLSYSHEALPGYQVLQLHFTGGDESGGLSMIFVLPLMATEELASSVRVLEAIPNLESTRVAVALPKFRFESQYEDDLKAALKAIDMAAPFDDDRVDNLCLVKDRCDAFIDLIIQKTLIDVNEKGVEAAAVTAIGIMLMSAPLEEDEPILFQADRPFQFFIHDQTEDLVLFEGQVGKPGIPAGSVAVLKAKHAQATFWQTTFGVTPVLPPTIVVTAETTVNVNEEAEVARVAAPQEASYENTAAEFTPEVLPSALASSASSIGSVVSILAGFLLFGVLNAL